jgi:hypothetical protein
MAPAPDARPEARTIGSSRRGRHFEIGNFSIEIGNTKHRHASGGAAGSFDSLAIKRPME